MAAYAVALSVVEALYSLFAVRRAKDGSGSDIIVAADPGDQLLESASGSRFQERWDQPMMFVIDLR
jgi:hypothetical protein